MYDRLLFPTDGGEGATAALDHVLDIAAEHGATLHVLNVADTTRDSVTRIGGEVVDALERAGQKAVEEAADRARERGIDVVTEVMQGEPAETIADYAAARGVDLVVMPTHGRRGLSRLLLGSTTERVLRQSAVPVLSLRPDDGVPSGYPYRRVLVPTDGSDCARAALSAGIEFAGATDGALYLLSVVDVASLGVDVRTEIETPALEEAAHGIVEEASAVAADAGVDPADARVEAGTSVHGEIVSYVEGNDIDLVVVGTHGRTGLDRYVLGSVATRLVRSSPVPVMTVRDAE